MMLTVKLRLIVLTDPQHARFKTGLEPIIFGGRSAEF